MTTNTEDLLWRRFNEWFRARRPDYPSEWDAYQAGHAAAKAETADVGPRGISLARELRDQADFDEAESVFGGGSRTRELMREAADAPHAGAEEHGE